MDFSETKMFATWTWIVVNAWEDLESGITTKTGKSKDLLQLRERLILLQYAQFITNFRFRFG